MGDTSRFDFCPKCGALARDGVCTSCGYENPEIIRQLAEAKEQDIPAAQPLEQPWPGQYPAYIPAAPAQQPQKNGTRTLVILSVVLAAALIAVVALILVGVYGIQKRYEGKNDGVDTSSRHSRELEEAMEEEEESHRTETDEQEQGAAQPAYSHFCVDMTEENWAEEGQDPSVPYYSGPYNSLRDDLIYEMSFQAETYFSEDKNVFLYVEYPQIVSKDFEHRRYINNALYYEYEYYLDFFKEKFEPLMSSEDDIFYCVIDSYVTYMDEKVLSVVFKENIQLNLENDPLQLVNFFCMTFDLETGTMLENTELLRMDEALAIDFRRREAEENGDEALTDYTDQEILEMLKDNSSLVIFYTPMGMEVGLNLGDRVVYVTYEDYEQYLNSF